MTEPVNNKVEVITRFEKGKPNTYSFDGGKTFIDKLPVNNQWLTEILVSYRNGTINPDPRKWATSDSNDLELAEQAILSKLESIEQEARIIKAGEVIPYKTIKGTDYVELNWLTRKFKGKG